MPRGFDLEVAHAHLRRVDRRLASWISRLEPVAGESSWKRGFDPVDALARSILYQQLSGKAADTIIGRVEMACAQRRLDADALSAITESDLRACGVSRAKALALADLSAHALRGELPSTREMARMDDESIVERLVRVRGIGRWTAEMLLVFRLGRPDVLPLDDLSLRKGLQRVDRLTELPSRLDLAQRGVIWAPFRTLAALYLWRVADSDSA